MLTRRRILAVAAALSLLPAAPAAAEEKPILVFAAASLKTALDEVAAAWQTETGKAVTVSYAASGALARQVEEGAPVDLFFSADLKWMDHLEKAGLVEPASRTALLGNELVLIAPADSTAVFEPKPGADLAALIGDGRIALGEPKSVPAGAYAKAALESLGLWAAVEPKAAFVDKVTAALTLVARGEAPFGVVYATDARAVPEVKVVAVFPASSHPPIVYPVARLKSSPSPDADAFLAYLKGEAAGAVFTEAGFTLLP
ncbi:molybdate ABC transporter substrate-binding protein [Chthonobacter albigriseus]|uniref:molybdate ABC transporter substrate-binding protein n=1 Tax=Chthonobacter albigriseus TaxID=1683161 RepID=UPI0015EF6196|nr:molybdate ABC transporter substrate-binding protein [Chthonobacter albigriseus]